MLGIPGTLPPTWCAHCQGQVTPVGKGQCPRCKRFVKGAFMARKHPVNVLRREQLIAQLVAEYNPATTIERAWCEDLAGVREQLENLRPGSTEWQRLVQTQQQLAASLEASRSERAQATPTDYTDLTDDELIERTATMLRTLLEVRDVKRRSAVVADPSPKGGAAVAAVEPRVTRTSPPVPELPCPHCYKTAAACSALRATNRSAWRALHWDVPEEAARRDAEATAVMMTMAGTPLPDWFRR